MHRTGGKASKDQERNLGREQNMKRGVKKRRVNNKGMSEEEKVKNGRED